MDSMKLIFHITLFALLPLMLSACAGGSGSEMAALTPLPGEPNDPPDSAVKLAIDDFLDTTSAPRASAYEFSRIDLNDDGRRDALVLFKNPYGYWCDMHGCTMLVLKAGDDTFKLVNDIQPIREPVYISENKTKGWKDLVVRVSGRWKAAKDVAIQYNGRNYHKNPDSLPPYMRVASNEEARLFME